MTTQSLSKLFFVLFFAATCGLAPALHAAPTTAKPAAVSRGDAAVVNINTATESELAFLPGIGPSRAQAIVAHRQKTPFKKAEDLRRIKGIGRKSLEKIRPYVTVDGPTTAASPIRVPK
jgi:competence protein ComEA